MNKRIDKLKYCKEMIQAIEQLDKADLSYILEKHLPFCFHIQDVEDILDKFVSDEYTQLAKDWFGEDDWIIYLETRYNLKFQERIEYVCYNPEDGIIRRDKDAD